MEEIHPLITVNCQKSQNLTVDLPSKSVKFNRQSSKLSPHRDLRKTLVLKATVVGYYRSPYKHV